MKISLLADYPEAIHTLAPWLIDYWRPILPDDTLELRLQRLTTHLQRDRLPKAWVAHREREVLGTAALRICDLEGFQQYTPWLGGVFVGPAHRNQGVGTALCAAVESHAFEVLCVPALYLFTLDRQAWYRQQGWRDLQPCEWQGRSGTIMKKFA